MQKNTTSYILRAKLSLLYFLQFAVWGSYLISLNNYLGKIGLQSWIGYFYAVQGFASLFMPAIMGYVADYKVSAHRVLSYCHLVAAVFMFLAGSYAGFAGSGVEPLLLFTLYSISIFAYMPTLSLVNSVSYQTLSASGQDILSHFPSIRLFGTIGFVAAMWLVDLTGFQHNHLQLWVSAIFGFLISIYTLQLPSCPVSAVPDKQSVWHRLGFSSFRLFRHPHLGILFLFSLLLGVCQQATDGFSNYYLSDFSKIPQYNQSFGVQHSNILISLSQISETVCILLVPLVMRRFSIHKVLLFSAVAWVLRLGLLSLRNPGNGLWMLILSMLVYGIAFNFLFVSLSIHIDKHVPLSQRSSAQGLLTLTTSGVGSILGSISAQWLLNSLTTQNHIHWQPFWGIFAAYAALIALFIAVNGMMLASKTNTNEAPTPSPIE